MTSINIKKSPEISEDKTGKNTKIIISHLQV